MPEVLEEVFIEGVKLDKQSSTKYLGLVIDENITWLLHVNHLTRKLSRFIPLLYNVRDSLLKDNLKLIYNSLICPLLTYGNVVWGGCCESYLGSLKVVQKKIMRIISFVDKFYHTAPLFYSFNILPFEQINSYMCINYVYRCLLSETNQLFIPWTATWLFITGHDWQMPPLLSLIIDLRIPGSPSDGGVTIYGILCHQLFVQ